MLHVFQLFKHFILSFFKKQTEVRVKFSSLYLYLRLFLAQCNILCIIQIHLYLLTQTLLVYLFVYLYVSVPVPYSQLPFIYISIHLSTFSCAPTHYPYYAILIRVAVLCIMNMLSYNNAGPQPMAQRFFVIQTKPEDILI